MINSKRLYFKVYSVVLITLALAYSLTYAFIMLLGLHYYEVWVEGLADICGHINPLWHPIG